MLDRGFCFVLFCFLIPHCSTVNPQFVRLSNVAAVSSEVRKLVGNGRSSFVVYSSQHVSSTLLENGGGTQKQKQYLSHLEVSFSCFTYTAVVLPCCLMCLLG